MTNTLEKFYAVYSLSMRGQCKKRRTLNCGPHRVSVAAATASVHPSVFGSSPWDESVCSIHLCTTLVKLYRPSPIYVGVTFHVRFYINWSHYLPSPVQNTVGSTMTTEGIALCLIWSTNFINSLITLLT